jgi:hypothetical protein
VESALQVTEFGAYHLPGSVGLFGAEEKAPQRWRTGRCDPEHFSID